MNLPSAREQCVPKFDGCDFQAATTYTVMEPDVGIAVF